MHHFVGLLCENGVLSQLKVCSIENLYEMNIYWTGAEVNPKMSHAVRRVEPVRCVRRLCDSPVGIIGLQE